MAHINGRFVKHTMRPRGRPFTKTGIFMGAQHWDMNMPADWQYLTPDQIRDLEAIVRKTGWSWNTIYDKTGMSIGEMNGVRSGKRPFAWDTWFGYLEAVAAAVEAVPLPPRPAFVPEGMAPVIPPAPSLTIEHVASTIGLLFLEADKMDPTERDVAQDAYSRVADALGIDTKVATVIRAHAPVGKGLAASRNAGMLRDAAA